MGWGSGCGACVCEVGWAGVGGVGRMMGWEQLWREGRNAVTLGRFDMEAASLAADQGTEALINALQTLSDEDEKLCIRVLHYSYCGTESSNLRENNKDF